MEAAPAEGLERRETDRDMHRVVFSTEARVQDLQTDVREIRTRLEDKKVPWPTILLSALLGVFTIFFGLNQIIENQLTPLRMAEDDNREHRITSQREHAEFQANDSGMQARLNVLERAMLDTTDQQRSIESRVDRLEATQE